MQRIMIEREVTMTTHRRSLALLLVLSFPAFLFAHDHHCLTGIITRVDSKDMDIKSTDGKAVTIPVIEVSKLPVGPERR